MQDWDETTVPQGYVERCLSLISLPNLDAVVGISQVQLGK